MRGSLAALVLLVGAAAVGCGGGGGDPVTVPLTASDDGFWAVDPTTFVSRVRTADPSGNVVGDDTFNSFAVAFVRFDLTSLLAGLPSGARITAATLTFTKVDVVGTPFASIGTDHRIHVDHGLFSVPTVADGDWSSLAPLGADVGFLVGGTDDANAQTFTVDVRSSLLADIAGGRTVSDYRFRFVTPTDSDLGTDLVRFADIDGNPGSSMAPVLIVEIGP